MHVCTCVWGSWWSDFPHASVESTHCEWACSLLTGTDRSTLTRTRQNKPINSHFTCLTYEICIDFIWPLSFYMCGNEPQLQIEMLVFTEVWKCSLKSAGLWSAFAFVRSIESVLFFVTFGSCITPALRVAWVKCLTMGLAFKVDYLVTHVFSHWVLITLNLRAPNPF